MSRGRKKQWQRVGIIGLFLLGIAAFFFFDLGQYLTLEYLKASHERLQALYLHNPIPFIAGYMGVYITVTALSLPGAAVLTLAGGGLFGFWIGTLVVSFASTIGASLACLVARFLLRDWVQNRFGDKLVTINAGIEKEGSFYLFTLRLVPIFPFFVINLLMGLTRMRLVTFFWVSQVGMLAGTMVYVNAGKELAQIDSLAGIISPGVLFSFALLGLFPLTVKKVLTWYRARYNLPPAPDDPTVP